MPTITGPTTIAAGEVQSFTSGTAYTLQQTISGPPAPFTINGTLIVDSGSAGGIVRGLTVTGTALQSSTVTIGPAGALKVYSAGPEGDATAYTAEGPTAPNLVNQGLIDVRGVVSAGGVVISGSASLNNSGTIHVLANGILGVPSGPAIGVHIDDPGAIINSGLIDVTGGSQAIGVETQPYVRGSFLNSGTIQVAALGPPGPFGPPTAFGVAWLDSGPFTNTGTIRATVAVESNAAVDVNSGQIFGDVRLGGFGASFTNSGTITGDVSLTTGNDTFAGGAGILHGQVRGGDGNDLIVGGPNQETFFGEAGNDTIEGGGGVGDFLDGGDGFDILSYAHMTAGVVVDLSTTLARNGADRVLNFEGVIGSSSADTLSGGVAAESLLGGGGDDSISGGGGDDTLNGGTGHDVISGGAGADRFVIGLRESSPVQGQADVIVDWSASDKLMFENSGFSTGDYMETTAADYASALSAANAAISAGLANFVAVAVGADVVVFADSAVDNGVADDAVILQGRSLADISASNILSLPATPGGAGTVFVLPPPPPAGIGGSSGTILGDMEHAHISFVLDAVITDGSDTFVNASIGDVGLVLRGSNFALDAAGHLAGGAATSIAYGYGVAHGGPFSINLSIAPVQLTTLAGWAATDDVTDFFNTLLGGNDSINGSAGVDVLHGYGGNDAIYGFGGSDTIWGGPGNDVIYATAPPGIPSFPAGTTYLRGEEGDDYIVGGAGFDDANGNMGNDTISTGAGDDYCVGGKDNDLLFGDDGNDIVWGNLGNDTCLGGAGADQVRGGQGDDVVVGGDGNDFISGDRGNDTESGGAGADIFHGSQDAGIDKVLDFNAAEGDRVMLDPGTTFTVSQVGADTIIDMGGGNEMILVGVQMSSLPPGTIFLG